MCKIQNKPQPVRKNTEDVSTKLNCQLNLKPKEGVVRTGRIASYDWFIPNSCSSKSVAYQLEGSLSSISTF